MTNQYKSAIISINLNLCKSAMIRGHSPKIALVYDKVNTWGGAERVLLAIHKIFPEAPLYTSVYKNPKDTTISSALEKRARNPNRSSEHVWDFSRNRPPAGGSPARNGTTWAKVFPGIIPSFLQKLPFATTHNHWYALLMPLAFESFNFDQYDIVISVTSGEAKGILTKPQTLHLCYCLTPTRYLWSDPGYQSYQNFEIRLPSLRKRGWGSSPSINLNNLIHLTKAPFLHYLRNWDYLAAQRPDHYATISITSLNRITKYYHRDSELIYPPIDTNFFIPVADKSHPKPSTLYPNPFFLVVSRLVPYKRVDLAIQACIQLGLNLKIAGTGPDLQNLMKRETRNAKRPHIDFLGPVTNNHLLDLYQHCTALIMPQEEDFGLVALEAQACGKPVIAYAHGGAAETIIHGKTGLLFPRQTPESLTHTLQQFNAQQFDSISCRTQALRFSFDNFKTKMRQYVLTKWHEHHAISSG